MIDSRTFLELKRDSAYRLLLWHTGLGSRRNIFLAEFPKSGGTWLAQMLSVLLSLPFPRNAPISSQPCILHGHHQIRSKNKKTIHLMRDGRDVMVSAYFYFVLNSRMETQKAWIKKMDGKDLKDVKSNLAQFIDIFFNNYESGWTRKTWNDFVIHYLNLERVIQVRYEDLNLNIVPTMTSLLQKLDVKVSQSDIEKVIEQFSFKNQTGREKGQSDDSSFLRKGSVGDWKTYFNPESAEVFNFYAGEALICAGYEKTKNWYH